MSNFLAIATATETLRDLLDGAVSRDVAGASATALPPNANEGLPERGVNVFLYQVTPNAAWRNADAPTRAADGGVIQRPRAAIDLHYLLSFYGDQPTLEPQRTMGSVLRTLHEQPVLTRRRVRDAIQAASWIATSNLDEETELVKFTQAALTLEEISKIWSVMLQLPYVLSVAFVGTVVLLDGQAPARPALPVRQRRLYIQTFREPVIDVVAAVAGPEAPIHAGDQIRISGARLRGAQTVLRFGLTEVTLASGEVGNEEIVAALPPGLQAGVRTVQVAHPTLMGEPLVPHGGVESNATPFMLQPEITANVSGVTPTLVDGSPVVVNGTTLRSATVRIDFTPAVGRRQRVRLLLSESGAPVGRPPRGYTFDAPPANGIAAPAQTETSQIDFAISGVFPGSYLARVQVDGVSSPLTTDADGRFDGPAVTI